MPTCFPILVEDCPCQELSQTTTLTVFNSDSFLELVFLLAVELLIPLVLVLPHVDSGPFLLHLVMKTC